MNISSNTFMVILSSVAIFLFWSSRADDRTAMIMVLINMFASIIVFYIFRNMESIAITTIITVSLSVCIGNKNNPLCNIYKLVAALYIFAAIGDMVVHNLSIISRIPKLFV